MTWTKSEAIVLPISLIIILLITVITVFILRNKDEKTKQVPFMILAIFLIVMEVIKQILAFPNYSLWNLPLHICSTFMVWYSLASFSKGKTSEIGFNLSVLFSFLFFISFYLKPSTIIGNAAQNILGSFSNFHTFIYHHVIILFTFLAIGLKKFKPKLAYLKQIIFSYTIYAILAIFFANLLQVNFASLLHNNIGFMQSLLENWGRIAYTIIMYFVGLGGIVGGLLISYYISKLNMKFKNKKKQI